MSPLRLERCDQGTGRWQQIGPDIQPGAGYGSISEQSPVGPRTYVFGIDQRTKQGFIVRTLGVVETDELTMAAVRSEPFEDIYKLDPGTSYQMLLNKRTRFRRVQVRLSYLTEPA